MADRPILFSAPMVLALLAGRKTQTRRLLPLPSWASTDPSHVEVQDDGSAEVICRDTGCLAAVPMRFSAGDRLWVREAWRAPYGLDYRVEELGRPRRPAEFDPSTTAVEYLADGKRELGGKDRSSLHMPRWASRLTLLVTDVRVERLQDISEGDAAAEGVELEGADPPFHYVPGIWPHSITAVGVEEPGGRHAARSFAKLWGHINGPESWQANPWVVVVGFSVHARNIDQLAPIAEAAE